MTRSRTLGFALVLGLALAAGCGDKSQGSASRPSVAGDSTPAPSADTPPAAPEPASEAAATASEPPGCPLPALASRYPAPDRIVAIGDVHGDLAAAKAALRAGGLIDADDRWSGGKTVLVQTGDQLDRGDDEQAIIDLLERLRGEAAKAGGAVHVLNGNHETMNARGDFRYVTPGGWVDFADTAIPSDDKRLANVPEAKRGRVVAFLPGGPYAKILSGHNVVVKVGDTVFVHGGVTPAFARYGIERFNREVRCWLAGHTPPPAAMRDASNPLWSRHFSAAPENCKMLEDSLRILGAKRMVMGHTPQVDKGANAACGGKAWRVDTGMAKHYGGRIQVLEIRGDRTKVLSAPRP